MNTAILGIGTVTALGCGIASLKNGLEGAKQPAIRLHSIDTAAGPISMPVYQVEIQGLDHFVPRASLRRIDRFPQMALLSASLAVEDSGGQLAEDRSRVGIVFGSAYGPAHTTFRFLDSVIDFGDRCASPTPFATSVHNSPASLVSMSLGITGPAITITCFEQTAKAVFEAAEMWLRSGAVDQVLVGLGDEYCPVLGYSVANFASGFSDIRPFDFRQCSYIPGEAFVCFLLGRHSEKCYATIGSDAYADYLFLAANGEKQSASGYERWVQSEKRCAAYSPLFGSMPLGVGVDIALAALSVRHGLIHPAPASTFRAPVPLAENETIGCLQCWNGGRFSICLQKPSAGAPL